MSIRPSTVSEVITQAAIDAVSTIALAEWMYTPAMLGELIAEHIHAALAVYEPDDMDKFQLEMDIGEVIDRRWGAGVDTSGVRMPEAVRYADEDIRDTLVARYVVIPKSDFRS